MCSARRLAADAHASRHAGKVLPAHVDHVLAMVRVDWRVRTADPVCLHQVMQCMEWPVQHTGSTKDEMVGT